MVTYYDSATDPKGNVTATRQVFAFGGDSTVWVNAVSNLIADQESSAVCTLSMTGGDGLDTFSVVYGEQRSYQMTGNVLNATVLAGLAPNVRIVISDDPQTLQVLTLGAVPGTLYVNITSNGYKVPLTDDNGVAMYGTATAASFNLHYTIPEGYIGTLNSFILTWPTKDDPDSDSASFSIYDRSGNLIATAPGGSAGSDVLGLADLQWVLADSSEYYPISKAGTGMPDLLPGMVLEIEATIATGDEIQYDCNVELMPI